MKLNHTSVYNETPCKLKSFNITPTSTNTVPVVSASSPYLLADENSKSLNSNSGFIPRIFALSLLKKPGALGLQHLTSSLCYPGVKGTVANPYPEIEYLPSPSTCHTSTKNLGQPLIVFALKCISNG